jgi:hypothetical protein
MEKRKIPLSIPILSSFLHPFILITDIILYIIGQTMGFKNETFNYDILIRELQHPT